MNTFQSKTTPKFAQIDDTNFLSFTIVVELYSRLLDMARKTGNDGKVKKAGFVHFWLQKMEKDIDLLGTGGKN